MEGISKIVDRIAAESREECAAIAASGAARCDEIRAALAEEEKQACGEILAAGTRDTNTRFELLGNLAAMEAKKQILAEKQRMLTAAFSLAETRLAELPDDKYAALLTKLASDAARTGREELIFSASDRAKHGQAVADAANTALRSRGQTGELVVSQATRDIRGGVIVSGGAVEVNCSVSALVERLRDELSPSVAGILFK